MKRVKDAFDERAAALDGLLGVGRSFDMIGRTLRIGGRRARLWVVNGYADDTVLERLSPHGCPSRRWRMWGHCRPLPTATSASATQQWRRTG